MLNRAPRVKTDAAEDESSLTLRSLFESEESLLLRYAYSLTGRRAVAEEIVQEVFLQLHTRWHEVEAPKAWLIRSVRNMAYNHTRNHKREVLGVPSTPAACPPTEELTPEEILVEIEETEALRQLIGALDKPDQELLKLKYFDELKYREISLQTGLSISNVGYRLHHILKGLASKLRPIGADENS